MSDSGRQETPVGDADIPSYRGLAAESRQETKTQTMSRQTIEAGENGTVVNVEEGVDYLVLHLPDGTTMDVSIDPDNEANHIKLYDQNEYAVMPMDEGSQIRPLEVWGPAASSSRLGTMPKRSVTVNREELVGEED